MAGLVEHVLGRLRELARDTESGAATTEFVLIFPLQLLLTLLIIQFAFLVHAHMVVSHAAFMGARAAAVADGLTDNQSPDVRKGAATRVAARTLGVLSSGQAPVNFTSPPELGALGGPGPNRLTWPSDGGQIGYSTQREDEAYGHLSVNVTDLTASPQDACVICTVDYDYVMTIPVARSVFAGFSSFMFQIRTPNNQAASQSRQRPVFHIHRGAYIPTPWTQPP